MPVCDKTLFSAYISCFSAFFDAYAGHIYATAYAVAIRFFVEHEELCNNTMIVASKGSPLEVLSAKLSNGQGGGYYIGGMLRNIVTDLGVVPIILKDPFYCRSYRQVVRS